ncbi:MAG TPA: GNAT family N-acetyltransferase, partial [Gaiellaceae bacterium]|nr:GNAT family N-acetyltransferase [Gaiellaceae bacterium]
RAAVEMTGTLREFRRRGLARLAKLATIRWAGENGITAIYTGNDTQNQPMLALNDDLGFEPSIVYQDFVKELR